MHKFVSLDHRIKLNSEIHLAPFSAAALYGRSIFTTAAVYQAKIFQWEKHWRRLHENSVRVGINFTDWSDTKVKKAIESLIAKNKLRNGRVRITIFDKSTGGIWAKNARSKSSLLVATADFRIRADEIRLGISPFPINSKSPLAGVKSGNYLEKLLALEECRQRSFDEAVCLNERGEVVSAVMANLFWVKGRRIFTAPLATGALRGTTRELIMENFPVTEKKISLETLKRADEIFVTSAGIGVTKILRFESRNLTDFRVSNQVQKFFRDLTA